MNKYTYRVYYKYLGPSKSDPFCSLKNPDEISEALRSFPNELPYYLTDQDATVFVDPNKQDDNTIIVIVTTNLSEAETEKAFIKSLDEHDLFGKKL